MRFCKSSVTKRGRIQGEIARGNQRDEDGRRGTDCREWPLAKKTKCVNGQVNLTLYLGCDLLAGLCDWRVTATLELRTRE